MRWQRKPENAGLRKWYWVPVLQVHVGLYDGEPAGMDTSGGRWQTVCEEHGSICSHDTLEIASTFGPCPEEWCEDCMKEWARWAR